MNFVNQHHDSISTVQLSPFGEEQWNRIITYSPIYVHWTDMLMISQQQRTNKPQSGKLNSKDQIDLNTMKLEDEILLNQLHQFRRAATMPPKGTSTEQESKVLHEEQDQHSASSTEDYRGSSEFFRESTETIKQHSSYIDPSFAQQSYITRRPILPNQTNPPSVNGHVQTNRFSNLNFGPKPQPSLSVQLRQSAIAREHVLSAAHDRQLPSPLSMSSSKRTITSAYSNYRHQLQSQYRTIQSPSTTDINSRTSYAHEQYTQESPPPSARKLRARSTVSSRSTIHMITTKNNRARQKQNIDLKTVLVEPWKQALNIPDILQDTIPNSLEIMHRMCGPATPFEKNLRCTFRRQLNQFRSGSMKA